MNTRLLILALSLSLCSQAQTNRWQQRVKYQMDVDMDVATNRLKGKQTLQYTNNSPDTLYQLFYHLYWNAFQPNSSMDVRSRELGKKQVGGRADWDPRVRDRISKLTPDEIGYQRVTRLTIGGVEQSLIEHETILEVKLRKPILPKATVSIQLDFEAQVPLQVRRAGRDNPNTTVRYSMSQWYPKLCAYDEQGWHPNPYIAREFYGEWGDFDVRIAIDPSYKLGGTGVLTNAASIGWGYDKPGTALKPITTPKRTWIFQAQNVHDFMWAADPDYKHLTYMVANRKSPVLHVLYKNPKSDEKVDQAWQQVGEAAQAVLPFIESKFGAYPYPQYSFIHGGDGGMEYPMGTLLAGPGLGTVFHEWMHSWYQMMLGTNESLYAWMDEGFTEFATNLVESYYRDNVTRPKVTDPKTLRAMDSTAALLPLDQYSNYQGYYSLVKSGFEEPLSTHADHYNTNFAYSQASYSKGCVMLEQLGYIIGAQVRDSLLMQYYRLYRYKHPTAQDFIRLAERQSGQQLDWYLEYWMNSTKTIDYKIDSLWEEGGVSNIRLRRVGLMPMPIDLQLTFTDGSSEMHYVPLNLQYGTKPAEKKDQLREIHKPWLWTHPTYTLSFKRRLTELKKAEIDPTKRLADLNARDNVLELNW